MRLKEVCERYPLAVSLLGGRHHVPLVLSRRCYPPVSQGGVGHPKVYEAGDIRVAVAVSLTRQALVALLSNPQRVGLSEQAMKMTALQVRGEMPEAIVLLLDEDSFFIGVPEPLREELNA